MRPGDNDVNRQATQSTATNIRKTEGIDDLRFTIYYMNFVTTRQSLSKLNFALAAPKFFDLFGYF